MDSRNETRNAAQPAGWSSRLITALAIGAACWLIGHSFDQSRRLQASAHLRADRMENAFAVQQGETTYRTAAGFLLLGGVGVVCWATATRTANWRHPLGWLAAIYLAWCAASLLWSIEPAQTFRKLAILMLLVTGALGLARRFSLEDIVWIGLITLAGLVGAGVVAEIANGTFRPWRADFRFSGTCHPNDQGVQCALLALLAGYAAWSERHRLWVRNGLVALALAGLWLTKSRTTLAAMLAAGAVAVLLHSRGMQRWLIVSAGTAALCIAVLAASFGSVATIDGALDMAAMGRRQDVSSLTGRLPLWQKAIEAAETRPLMGHGYGAFWGERNVLKYSKAFSWHIPHAHNAYLDLILETGFVGLALYLAWVLTTAATVAIEHERHGRGAERFAACLVVFSLVHGLTESKFPGAGVAGFFLLAVLMSFLVGRSAPAPTAQPVRSWHSRTVANRFAPLSAN